MKSSYSTLMQSKFFNPAFNSAIFDGPIRIYFAQFHESLALKIYFMIQQKLSEQVTRAKDISKATGANILVMVYPSEESFLMSFEGQNQTSHPLALEKWNEDVVVGLRGPIDDQHLDLLVETIGLAIQNWKPSLKAVPELQFEA
ncbi:hypothetical protein [Bdellovibrio sp. HCB337]|uniref:hypothetical protein n=1 Tax=Bdellovibrio sp. HCB337 TaxID=3394358 RepID=UPI0039A73A95